MNYLKLLDMCWYRILISIPQLINETNFESFNSIYFNKYLKLKMYIIRRYEREVKK